MQQRLGIKSDVCSSDLLPRLLPGVITDDVAGAAWEPESGYADRNATAFAFAAAAARAGARVETGREVTRVVVERGRVVAVETREGRVATRVVVLVPGAWARPLLEPLGLGFGLLPYRIQVAIFRWPAGMARGHPVVIDAVHKSWMRPDGSAATLIGVELGVGHADRSEEHTSELQSQSNLVCRLLLEK